MLYSPWGSGGKRISYTRVSTMARWLDDKGGLIQWSAAMAMIGMAKSKPLQARVASIIARSTDDPYNENKTALKELVETATTLAQASGRADYGTSIHEFSELLDAGLLDWSFVPDKLIGPLEAYREATQDLKVLDTEVFVTLDDWERDLRGAGSLDRVVSHPDLGVVVADLKTGAREPQYPMGVTTQVAVYARGKRYRDSEFHGTPTFTDGTPNADKTAWRKPLYEGVRTDVGLLIHCPLEPQRGKHRCTLYVLDLERGWKNLLLGSEVQLARKPPKLERL